VYVYWHRAGARSSLSNVQVLMLAGTGAGLFTNSYSASRINSGEKLSIGAPDVFGLAPNGGGPVCKNKLMDHCL
jgi:hypothetical protein